jgi:hypothetical protein
MNDDFYIGWEDKAPEGYARVTRRVVAALLGLVLLAGAGLAGAQRLIGVAFFEWGNVKEFHGFLRADPYPHLVLPAGSSKKDSTRLLVAPFKFGLKRETICGFDGQHVTLRATRIHRDGQLMLEVEPASIRSVTPVVSAREETGGKLPPSTAGETPAATVVSLGRHTFRGEIVDSKCWMGVMNPGVLTPHRACAVRCISGGIPPMLLVRREGAPLLNLLLVSPQDKPVNDAVLDLVAEPVEVTGELVRQGELLTLRADPASYRRISK